jgi:hypothetical protein
MSLFEITIRRESLGLWPLVIESSFVGEFVRDGEDL